MFYPIKLYFRDLWIAAPFAGSVLSQIFIWLYLFFNIKPGAEQVFLHYNIIFGVDLVGDWWNIFYTPLFGLLILAVNFCFSFLIYRADKFLARILNLFALATQLIIIAFSILIAGLNA
ncbi:MAG: hypothetical protein WC430_00970 [Patescibacteria group bacterium]